MAHRNIVIVGAGPAGIAAASRLLSKGVNNITILEGEDRIGGRVHTTSFGEGVVDLGAQFCHGEKGNVVFDMAHPLQLLESSNTPYTNWYFADSTGMMVKPEKTARLFELCLSITDSAGQDVKNIDDSLGDFICSEYKRQSELYGAGELEPALAGQFLDWFHRYENSIDGSDSWFDTSRSGHAEYWECEGDPVLTWKKTGYGRIFDLLMCRYPDPSKALPVDEKIQFQKEVTKIEWERPHSDGAVQVHCNDGTRVEADHVILTVSLGVLKEQVSNLFSPPVPTKKLNAISGLSIGTVNKIFLKFPYCWWPDEIKGFGLLWTKEDVLHFAAKEGLDEKRAWMLEVFGFNLDPGQPGVLCGWVSGPSARLMENCSDVEVLSGCQQLLDRFFGHTYSIPPIQRLIRSKWHTNPHFRGSYSFRSLQSERLGAYAKHLAEPLVNGHGQQVVLFAGEATHDHYYSTVHGAIESGWREADRIINDLRCRRSSL